MDEAIRQLHCWDEAHPGHRLHLNVNVSPRQLTDPGFAARTEAVLRRRQIAGSRITLEITEAAFGFDIETMIVRLHELKALGVLLAIDDFGTGYSSLSQLSRLPVDVIKVDKSFVDGIATEPAEWALTTAIIRLAASLRKQRLPKASRPVASSPTCGASTSSSGRGTCSRSRWRPTPSPSS